MEEKRSCHSLHSVRSTRSFLTRPTSDISYIEDAEDKWKKEQGIKSVGNNVSASGNGHYVRGHSEPKGNSVNAKPGLVTEGGGSANNNCTNISSQHYLKVEGGAYRLQRSASPAATHNISAQSQTTGVGVGDTGPGPGVELRVRASTDAATQSCASSCTQTEESCLAPLVLHAPAPAPAPLPHPPPPLYMEPGLELGRAGSALGLPYTRGTSPTPPQHYMMAAAPPPTSCYHAYDPSTAYYHTYLNPMVEAGGLQYDIVVRRPSVGPAPELSGPGDPAGLHRRPSHPGHLVHHHLAPHSLPGSFDSSLPPPLPPTSPLPPGVGVGVPLPLSPRHLGGPNTSTSPLAPLLPSEPEPALGSDPLASKHVPIPAPASTTDIPKLIHETSI